MQELQIIIPSTPAGDTSHPVQKMEITHLAARKRSLGDLANAGVGSPGVVILIPQSDSFSLSFGDHARLMVPGLACLANGSAPGLPILPSDDEDEHSSASILMIEINGVIDDALPLAELLNLPNTLAVFETEEAERLYKQLAASPASLVLKTGGVDLAQHAIAVRLVVLLLSAAGTQKLEEIRGDTNEDLMRLKQLMMKQLYTNPSMAELASCMGMSRTAFYRWATPALGESPASHMRKLRLEKSQELLCNTSLTVEEIAAKTGFYSRDHLEKQFRKRFGTSPAGMRRAAVQKSREDPSDQVERLLRDHQFNEALQACETIWKRAREPESRDRLRYQKAQCLHAMGRAEEAVSLWQSLNATAWAFEAGVQLCNHYFHLGKYPAAVSAMADTYKQSTHSQKEELVLLWNHQVARLVAQATPRPLPRYLEIRAELFPDNLRTMTLTATVLCGLGRADRVPRQCAPMKELCFSALRHSGQYRQAIEQYGAGIPKDTILGTLVEAGQYEEVMAMVPEDPRIMVKALTRSGRAAEAIQRFPDHCEEAYLVLGRYEELLDRFPRPMDYHLYALRALGRTDDLRNYSRNEYWLWRLAQFLAGPDHALGALSPHDGSIYVKTLLWKTLRHLTGNETSQAMARLEEIPLFAGTVFWSGSRWPKEILLSTVTRGLSQRRDMMRTELEAIEARCRYLDGQRLWHDASFLLGSINEQQYRNQPRQVYLKERLSVMKAINHDLKGESRQAEESYRSFIANSAFKKKLLQEPELQEFMTWRLAILSTDQRNIDGCLAKTKDNIADDSIVEQ